MDRDVYLLLLGFVLGLLGNYVVHWYAQYRRDTLIRRAMREALTAEVIFNLEVMDNNERVLRKSINDGTLVWPDTPYSVHVLNGCLDPDVLGILTEGEQVKIPLVYQQVAQLRDEFEDIRLRLPGMTAEYRLERLWKLLDQEIPYPAANLMDLLCKLLEHQDCYSSERSIEMASKVLPTTIQRGRSSARIWRTSDLDRVRGSKGEPGDTLLAWRNDAPDRVPAGVKVIEVAFGRTPFGTFERKERSWLALLIGPNRQRRKQNAARRDADAIQASKRSSQAPQAEQSTTQS